MCGKFLHFKTGHGPTDVNLCNIFVSVSVCLCVCFTFFNKEDQTWSWFQVHMNNSEIQKKRTPSSAASMLFPHSELKTQTQKKLRFGKCDPLSTEYHHRTEWTLLCALPSKHQCIQLWWLPTLLSCHSSADSPVQTGLWALHPTEPTDQYDGHKLEWSGALYGTAVEARRCCLPRLVHSVSLKPWVHRPKSSDHREVEQNLQILREDPSAPAGLFFSETSEQMHSDLLKDNEILAKGESQWILNIWVFIWELRYSENGLVLYLQPVHGCLIAPAQDSCFNIETLKCEKEPRCNAEQHSDNHSGSVGVPLRRNSRPIRILVLTTSLSPADSLSSWSEQR